MQVVDCLCVVSKKGIHDGFCSVFDLWEDSASVT